MTIGDIKYELNNVMEQESLSDLMYNQLHYFLCCAYPILFNKYSFQSHPFGTIDSTFREHIREKNDDVEYYIKADFFIALDRLLKKNPKIKEYNVTDFVTLNQLHFSWKAYYSYMQRHKDFKAMTIEPKWLIKQNELLSFTHK